VPRAILRLLVSATGRRSVLWSEDDG
jgi:hypothetical protein